MDQVTNEPRKRSFRSINVVIAHIKIFGVERAMPRHEIHHLAFVLKTAKDRGNKLTPDIERLAEVTRKAHGIAALSLAETAK